MLEHAFVGHLLGEFGQSSVPDDGRSVVDMAILVMLAKNVCYRFICMRAANRGFPFALVLGGGGSGRLHSKEASDESEGDEIDVDHNENRKLATLEGGRIGSEINELVGRLYTSVIKPVTRKSTNQQWSYSKIDVKNVVVENMSYQMSTMHEQGLISCDILHDSPRGNFK